MIFINYLKQEILKENIHFLEKHLKNAVNIINEAFKRDGKIAGLQLD